MINSRAHQPLSHNFITLLLACSLFCFPFLQADAQKAFTVSVRPAANFPTTDLYATELNTGYGIEGTVGFRFLPRFGAYGGWSYNRFPGAQMFTHAELELVETGYAFGVQYFHPMDTDIEVTFKAGGLYNHLETTNQKGDILARTGDGYGWELEAGLILQLSKKLSLNPGARYRSVSRKLEGEGFSSRLNHNYISVGVGICWSF